MTYATSPYCAATVKHDSIQIGIPREKFLPCTPSYGATPTPRYPERAGPLFAGLLSNYECGRSLDHFLLGKTYILNYIALPFCLE